MKSKRQERYGAAYKSICIVNWNCCEYLGALLTSIESQRDRLSIEIIVVDNASTDDSAAVEKQHTMEKRLEAKSFTHIPLRLPIGRDETRRNSCHFRMVFRKNLPAVDWSFSDQRIVSIDKCILT